MSNSISLILLAYLVRQSKGNLWSGLKQQKSDAEHGVDLDNTNMN